MKKIKNIAIIPARGGSKRIPKKNSKDFFGKPIIAYSIEAALESKLFDEVMVSTDDEDIAKVAREYKAKVPFFRTKKNAGDHSTLVDVLDEVVAEYKKSMLNFDNVCCILPTAPFLRAKHLIDAYKLLNDKGFYSVFPIVEFSYPIQRSLVKNEDGNIEMAYPKYLNTRSQDLLKHYHDSGQFYWIKTSILQTEKTLFTSKSGGIELSQLEVQDIDTIDDWQHAEVKYKIIHGK